LSPHPQPNASSASPDFVSPDGAALARRFQYDVPDFLCIVAGVCLTFAISLRLGLGRLLWEDEVLGWSMLRDRSWRHMFYSWQHGADGGGALFYITGRLWFLLFGDSNLSFRSYSATCFAIAFVLVWLLARRFYSLPAVAFGMLVGWFLSPALAPHMAEGRFYGLFVAATAAAALLVLRSFERTQSSARKYLATFLVFSVLVASHILGICYVGILLLGWFVADALQGLRRIRLYLTALASGVWLIPSLPAIQASAAVGKPHFWTTQPTFFNFLLGYVGGSLRAGIIGLFLIATLLPLMLWGGKRELVWAAARQRMPILAVMGALFLIPLLFYAEGFVSAPLFNTRYMQPVALATVVFFAELVTQVDTLFLTRFQLRRVVVGVVCASTLAMVLQYDLVYLPRYAAPQLDYAAALTSALPPRVAIVCEDAFTFTELMRDESTSKVRYQYLLDWENAVNNNEHRLEVTQFHLMENWRNVGYYSDHIAYREEFLSHYPFFLVMHTTQEDLSTLVHGAGTSNRDKMIGNPLASRFAEDPGYQELPFLTWSSGVLHEQVSLICRKGIDCAAVRDRLRSSNASERTSAQR
jgi:hypothetical protein